VNSNAWWPNLIVMLVAAGIDLRTRRIPNWLSVPFLVAGFAVQSIAGGWLGLQDSFEGFGLAVLLFGPPCFLRVMGMGDLKLAAGVGAWIGPSQFIMAFLVSGMVGGVMAAIYAARRGSLGECLNTTRESVGTLAPGRFRNRFRIDSATASAIPYAPAIAIGTLFSFFTR
jgi:prepilin peptidase CpaA